MSHESVGVMPLASDTGGAEAIPATPEGDGHPRGAVSMEVWQAFTRAVEQSRVAFEGGADPSGLRVFLSMLEDAVGRVIDAQPLSMDDVPAGVPSVRVLEHVRRAFVDEVRADDLHDAQHAIHILSALGHVQCVLDRAASTEGAQHVVEREALGLIVEVAHDMRSPLAAILFLIDMLRTGRTGAISTQQARQLGMVYGAALGLNQLACDLIDFVRGHDRLLDQHPVPFSISQVFRSVHDIVQPMAEEKGVSVRLLTPDADVRHGLPVALNRILLNLTTNAVKFAKEGPVVVTARELSATRVEFSVRDSGRGIPMSVLGQLFQPFRKPRRTNVYTFSSAGLGLSICHKLATAMGSELRVTTSAKHGTRFYFELDLPIASD